jgi:hypothetical protein
LKGKVMADEKKVTLVGNKSSGYNYKYTSLGDLVLAGVELPPMRVAVLVDGEQTPVVVNGQPIEYIEAYVNGSWERGARIVIPSGNKMNEAQAYGSALTYARRYTALSVLGIACDDDNKIEVHSKEESDEQILENMSKDLKELYKKAGGKDFSKWVEDCGGLTAETYPKMKTTLLKQINDKAEKESKS